MKLTEKLHLCWRVLQAHPGNLMRHAERELPPGDDEMQALMNAQLKELILVFSTHGHSGFSASYATAALEKLLRYKPLRPLTGEANEWNEVGDGVFQNNRCSHVFKQADRFNGQAYDMNGRVFREPSGACYTSKDSFVPIVFPYTPTTEYVDVPGDEDAQKAE
ncbi:MAG: hypothetical protein ACR2IY_02500 [Rubrivivax sp.]